MAVIIVVPELWPVIKPLLEIVATLVFPDRQIA